MIRVLCARRLRMLARGRPVRMASVIVSIESPVRIRLMVAAEGDEARVAFPAIRRHEPCLLLDATTMDEITDRVLGDEAVLQAIARR